MAAPAIPSFGRPNIPKINNGSSAILTNAPTICAIIGVRISPFACKIFVQILSVNNPILNTQTIRPYTITFLITSGESVDIRAYTGMHTKHTTANSAHSTRVSGVPIPPYSFAFFSSCTPR